MHGPVPLPFLVVLAALFAFPPAQAQPTDGALISFSASYLMMAHACAAPLGDPQLPEQAYVDLKSLLLARGQPEAEITEHLGLFHERLNKGFQSQMTREQCEETFRQFRQTFETIRSGQT